MATQARLFEQEQKLIDLAQTVKELQAEARAEGEYMQTGGVYPENYDPWGTIGVNAVVLEIELTKLASDIRGALSRTHR